MSEKNRVEIHDFKDWKAGVYLIEAGCGQGKNYFVFNTLFPYAHENGKRMLVFSNRVALREQQQAQTQEKDVKLITYQSLEHDEYLETMQDTKNKVRGLMQQVGEYDYIILDEAHYLYQDAPFNKNTETIIELIEKYRSSKIIVLLSATPDLLKKYLRIDKPYFFKADYSYIKEVQYYTKRDTLDEIISKIPENEKIVVFADSKDRLKELHSEYPNSAYLDASNKKRRKVFNGNICDVEEIDRIAKKYGLKVIYDAAHAFAVKYNGVSTACFGDASMFSFHATKVFNTIEGGAVCFKDDSWVQLLNDQKNFGIHGPESVCFVGGNAKMNEFQAAMGICNLRHLDEEIAKRKKVVERYRERLSGVEGIKLSAIQENVESNYAYFPVVFDGYKYTRNEIFEMLSEQGITARKYFYPLTNSFECYRNYPTAGTEKTPVAQHLTLRVLTLPLYADLPLEDVNHICDIILN